jgi:hypothetical protein
LSGALLRTKLGTLAGRSRAPAVEAWWARGLLLNSSDKLCHLRIEHGLAFNAVTSDVLRCTWSAQVGLFLSSPACSISLHYVVRLQIRIANSSEEL